MIIRQSARTPNPPVMMLQMSLAEYNQVNDFMLANGVGYGPSRKVTDEWRKAKEKYDREHTPVTDPTTVNPIQETREMRQAYVDEFLAAPGVDELEERLRHLEARKTV